MDEEKMKRAQHWFDRALVRDGKPNKDAQDEAFVERALTLACKLELEAGAA